MAYKTHKQKGQKQGIQVNPRVVLSKEEYRQWKYLKGKNLSITQKQLKSYLIDVKKANAKLNELDRSENFFGEKITLSTDISMVDSQADLERYLKLPTDILDPTYEERITNLNIEKLNENVKAIFGDAVSFKNLTPAQLKQFFKENESLRSLMFYAKEEEIKNVTNMLFESQEGLQMAIDFYKDK